MKKPWRGHENSMNFLHIHRIFIGPLKTSELWHHEIFGHEIHGFLSTFEKAMKCHFHGYFMASRSLYSIFHGSWIWKFSQVFHGIFQVFFMALRPWKCHWFNHENPVKNLWIYNELFHKIFMVFDFIVIIPMVKNERFLQRIQLIPYHAKWLLLQISSVQHKQWLL